MPCLFTENIDLPKGRKKREIGNDQDELHELSMK